MSTLPKPFITPRSSTKDLWTIRSLTAVVIFLICLVMALCSCGSTTRAVIKAGDTATSTSITITTNNPSTIDVQPNIEANISTTPKN